MSRLIKVTDIETGTTRHILEVDRADTFSAALDTALDEADRLHIDVDALSPGEIVKIAGQIPSVHQDRVRLTAGPDALTETLVASLGVSCIAIENGRFLLRLGMQDPAAAERFRTLKHNLNLKNKTYEMEIIESLLTDASAETQKYRELKSRYDSLQAASKVRQDEELAERYLNVMDKYKQALERLDRLRKSKLGRLQMAYWDRKGKH